MVLDTDLWLISRALPKDKWTHGTPPRDGQVGYQEVARRAPHIEAVLLAAGLPVWPRAPYRGAATPRGAHDVRPSQGARVCVGGRARPRVGQGRREGWTGSVGWGRDGDGHDNLSGELTCVLSLEAGANRFEKNDPQHLSGLVRKIMYQFIGPN
jgi:hypothetical protein